MRMSQTFTNRSHRPVPAGRLLFCDRFVEGKQPFEEADHGVDAAATDWLSSNLLEIQSSKTMCHAGLLPNNVARDGPTG